MNVAHNVPKRAPVDVCMAAPLAIKQVARGASRSSAIILVFISFIIILALVVLDDAASWLAAANSWPPPSECGR